MTEATLVALAGIGGTLVGPLILHWLTKQNEQQLWMRQQELERARRDEERARAELLQLRGVYHTALISLQILLREPQAMEHWEAALGAVTELVLLTPEMDQEKRDWLIDHLRRRDGNAIALHGHLLDLLEQDRRLQRAAQ